MVVTERQTGVPLNGETVVGISPPAQQIINEITDSQHPVTVFPEQLPYQTKPPQNGVVWTRTQEKPDGKLTTTPEIANLVTLAQQGSMEAFGQIYDNLHPKIVSYLRFHLNGRRDIAEDLAGDVFLKAMEKLDTYQAMDSIPFTAWIYRVTHNLLVDYIRTHRTEEVSLDKLVNFDELMTQQAGVVDIEELALDKVEVEAIIQLTRYLTPNQREVFRRRFLEDKSIADTARVMGKEENAVKQLQVRALRELRKLIKNPKNQEAHLIR